MACLRASTQFPLCLDPVSNFERLHLCFNLCGASFDVIDLCVLLLFFVGRALFFLAFVGLPTSFVVMHVFFVYCRFVRVSSFLPVL